MERIMELEIEMSKMDKAIHFKEEQNESYRKKIEARLDANSREMVIEQQRKKNLVLFKELHHSINDIQKQNDQLQLQLHSIIEFQLERLNELRALITQITQIKRIKNEKLVTSVVNVKKNITAKHKQIQHIKMQLLSKVQRICGLTDSSIFNLSNIPEDYKEWKTKLTPEQVSVIISYIMHVIRLFEIYENVPTRYKVTQNRVYDPVYKISYKLHETNYRAFKNEGTLEKTIQVLTQICNDLYYHHKRELHNTASGSGNLNNPFYLLTQICKSIKQ